MSDLIVNTVTAGDLSRQLPMRLQAMERCLLNPLFRCRSKNTSKLSVTGLYEGTSPVTEASNADMFPFDDVVMMLRKTLCEIQRP